MTLRHLSSLHETQGLIEATLNIRLLKITPSSSADNLVVRGLGFGVLGKDIQDRSWKFLRELSPSDLVEAKFGWRGSARPKGTEIDRTYAERRPLATVS